MDIREFDTLYTKLAPLVFRRAFILIRDENEARDFVQSAFMSLWEHRDTIQNPAAFVNSAVTNMINSYYRSLSSRDRFGRLYPIELESTDEAPPAMDEILTFMDNTLTEAVCRVVRCVFFKKMSYRQTADMLSISESTVNKHIVTALKALRKRFKKEK